MNEIKLSEVSEVKKPDIENYKSIKSEGNISVKEAKDFWKNEAFKENEESLHNPYEEKLKYVPSESKEDGHWKDERGESKFIPNDSTEAGKLAKEKLIEKKLDGIEYKNAEPDFSPCAEATVQIENMTENRYNYIDSNEKSCLGNFAQADIKCAEKWSSIKKDGKSDWTARDINNWRHENKCSWHERCDTKTMDLVSRDIHSFFKHSGGVSECKARDNKNLGGGFDE